MREQQNGQINQQEVLLKAMLDRPKSEREGDTDEKAGNRAGRMEFERTRRSIGWLIGRLVD